MAHPVKDIIRWLETLPENSCVGIDEGGLTLLCDDEPEAYYEIGGMPLEDDEDDDEIDPDLAEEARCEELHAAMADELYGTD